MTPTAAPTAPPIAPPIDESRWNSFDTNTTTTADKAAAKAAAKRILAFIAGFHRKGSEEASKYNGLPPQRMMASCRKESGQLPAVVTTSAFRRRVKRATKDDATVCWLRELVVAGSGRVFRCAIVRSSLAECLFLTVARSIAPGTESKSTFWPKIARITIQAVTREIGIQWFPRAAGERDSFSA